LGKEAGEENGSWWDEPIDSNWLKHIASKNALQFIDVIGIHGFPDVFDVHWKGWKYNIAKVKDVLDGFGLKQEIWITETGYSTWKQDERKQVKNFLQILEAPVNRVYWYSLKDLSPEIPTVDGFHFDEREYNFGLITSDGRQKLLYRLWAAGGISNIIENAWMAEPPRPIVKSGKEQVMITGGAGFIGTNLANRLLIEGYGVTIFDNLSRPGVEKNLAWLKEKHPQIRTVIADVRDQYAVEQAVKDAAHVFHFAAQVAVTTSLEYPVFDYEVNLKGTVNVLEAIRKSVHKPSLIFTSTNKVYGNLEDIEIKANSTRYYPENKALEKQGISESRSLDFHSPYGSSKGAADQYVLDYARSYGLRTTVFRMSCIYGPHQFGTEDQGWVAHLY
jgi:CDP-paratose 2-epimerase